VWVAAGLWNLQAIAQPLPAPSLPPELRVALPTAQRAGTTRLRVWGFDVYDASLWVAPGFRAETWAQGAFALELRYLRAFDGDDIARRSLDEMARGGSMSRTQETDWMRAMQPVFPDVKKGDRITGVYDPGKGARFFYNGAPHGDVNDAAFAERFFAIWLGQRTSEPAMRAALLAPLRSSFPAAAP
jgi:hypothetical protein